MSDSQSSRPLAPAPGHPETQNAATEEANTVRKHKTTACRACKQKKLKVLSFTSPDFLEHCVADRGAVFSAGATRLANIVLPMASNAMSTKWPTCAGKLR